MLGSDKQRQGVLPEGSSKTPTVWPSPCRLPMHPPSELLFCRWLWRVGEAPGHCEGSRLGIQEDLGGAEDFIFCPHTPLRSGRPALSGISGDHEDVLGTLFRPHVSRVRDIRLPLPWCVISGLDDILNEDSCFYFQKFCASL